MKIKRIQLERIGPFRSLELVFPEKAAEPGSIHLFTGPNGCGKSTLLYALAGMLGYDGLIRKRFWGSTSRFGIVFEPPMTRDLAGSKSKPPQHFWTEDCDEVRWYQAAFAYSGQRRLAAGSVEAMKPLESHPLEESLTFRETPDSGQILQWIANQRTREALFRMNNQQDKADRHAKAVTRVDRAVSDMIDMDFQFVVNADPLGVGVTVDGRPLGIEVLPDGLKSIISWVADLLMRLDRTPWTSDVDLFEREIILLLDEVDIHLHPKWQRKILPAVRALFPRAQIFGSTHSPFVVNSVADAWVYRFDLDQGLSVLTSQTQTRTANSLSLVLSEIFGVEEAFGQDVERAFDVFYQLKKKVAGDDAHRADFMVLARELASQSLEVRDIVGRELQQLSRITGREFSLL